MIEYFAYDFGLILFTRFKVFEKYRNAMDFKSIFLLTLVTIIILIMSIVTILNQNTFLGLNTTNPVVKRIILLLYLGTKSTLFAYLLSDYFRDKSDSKVPISGQKGNKGMRGLPGNKSDKCDKKKCNLNICNDKLLLHVTQVYSDILKSRNKKTSKHYPLTNNFIKNKIKTLCLSPQLEKVLDNSNDKSVYTFIYNTWKKWIHIILKYENGEYFMETDYLTDNDFDNLIDVKDKIYNPNFNNNNEGTPSKGKESPFDEIKKYDMWYWGEPQAAKVKIKYKCDLDSDSASGPKNYNINVKKSQDYKQKWRSSVALQTQNNDIYTPFQHKTNSDITVYRPTTIDDNGTIFYPSGDIIVNGDNVQPNSGDVTLLSGDVLHPDGFKKLYGFQRTKGIGKGVIGYSFWQPNNPTNYTCLGNAIETTYKQTEPNSLDFACVPSVCTQPIIKSVDKNVQTYNIVNSEDDDNMGSEVLTNLYSHNAEMHLTNDPNKIYELIPEGQVYNNNPSCINNTKVLDSNKGSWIVEPKNSKKYSIHAHFNAKE